MFRVYFRFVLGFFRVNVRFCQDLHEGLDGLVVQGLLRVGLVLL